MSSSIIQQIAKELSISEKQVSSVLELTKTGATIPFIARYRKEKTGSLDEVQIEQIINLNDKIIELNTRREFILKTIKEQGNLTGELERVIKNCTVLSELEDIYLPFKPKRRTKATIAKEKDLEPLAQAIWSNKTNDPNHLAKSHLSHKEVKNVEEALEGARHIIAEWINETAVVRNDLRKLFKNDATIISKVVKTKKDQAEKFKDYFDWQEKLKNIPSHRLLAIRRGEKEGFLRVNISPEEERALSIIKRNCPRVNYSCFKQVEEASADAYKRLLQPSLETEFRGDSKDSADFTAIDVFGTNLRELLMASPLGQKRILALDPGFRTGCKLVCIDAQGNLLENDAIFPNEPQKKIQASGETIKHLVKKHKVEAIAIGNGTASRETERFVNQIAEVSSLPVIMVNESGASIYSASELAREEFPNHDVTVRGAVSIARRLADPLAELVKLDPKSIGVGQYQHDVDQSLLKKSLDTVVSSCVNKVGVELNTASKQLLTYVSGLNTTLAQNIIDYRKENGAFKSRAELKKVARMGAKSFEQCAGFLRIRNAKNPLDRSAVHPERYALVKKMATDLKCTVEVLMNSKELHAKLNLNTYVNEEVGLPTLKDILTELDKPGRDPREAFEPFAFADGIEHMEDLQSGMELPGIVTNVTNFGAFVDVGVHQDGLVHISQLSDTFVSDPNEIVKVNQKVKIKVLEVDVARKRLAFSMKTH